MERQREDDNSKQGLSPQPWDRRQSEGKSYPALGFRFLPASLTPASITAVDTVGFLRTEMGGNSKNHPPLQFPPFPLMRTFILLPWTSALGISGFPIKMSQTECPK